MLRPLTARGRKRDRPVGASGLLSAASTYHVYGLRRGGQVVVLAARVADPERGDVDETWIGGKPKNRHGHKCGQGGQGKTDKTPVVALVSRETGEVRSRVVPNVKGHNLRRVLDEHVDVTATHLHPTLRARTSRLAPTSWSTPRSTIGPASTCAAT